MTFLFLLWLVPTLSWTTYTALSLGYAWTGSLNRRLPAVLAANPVLMAYNPKDDYLYQRPSPLMALGVLALGALPAINLVLTGFYIYVPLRVWWDCRDVVPSKSV